MVVGQRETPLLDSYRVEYVKDTLTVSEYGTYVGWQSAKTRLFHRVDTARGM